MTQRCRSGAVSNVACTCWFGPFCFPDRVRLQPHGLCSPDHGPWLCHTCATLGASSMQFRASAGKIDRLPAKVTRMNVIAGILIGIVNDSWLTRIIAPFIWGFVIYGYTMTFRKGRHDSYVAANAGRKLRWGWSPRLSFFWIEYWTATTTSLIFSLLAGLIYGIVKR